MRAPKISPRSQLGQLMRAFHDCAPYQRIRILALARRFAKLNQQAKGGAK
jgi:hypothetical protein